MREDNKVTIDEIFTGLKLQMGDDFPFAKFKVAFGCWRQKGIRLRRHSAAFYTAAWRRGWLPKTDADDFCNYLITGWRL